MVARLVRLSLGHRALVLALAALLLAVGIARVRSMPVDVFPDRRRHA